MKFDHCFRSNYGERLVEWFACNVFVPELVPKTRIYIYQNKYTANREYDIYSSTIWSTSRNYPREIKRPIVYLPWQYLHATNNRFSNAIVWWGGLKGIISGQNSSRFDEFRRNGRREVGNFAAQERNYGSPDETWLAIGLSSYPGLRRAPPILTEARPLFSPGRRRHAAASNGLAGGFN